VDAHAHVFTRRLTLASVHRYAPDYDALPESLISLLKAHGLARCVLIQPSFLGTDNSYMVAALKAYPKVFRGVAVVNPETDLNSLEALSKAGCVGLRLNLFGLPNPDLGSTAWRRVLDSIGVLGWHIEVHAEAARMAELLRPMQEARLKLVIDHFGRPDPELGVNDPGFRFLLKASESRSVWMKISGAYRNGTNGRGEQMAMEAMPLLRSSFGLERLLWGSDWPHTQFESKENYEKSLDILKRIMPEEHDRQQIFVETPKVLYGL